MAELDDGCVPTQELRQEQFDDRTFTYDHVMLIYGLAVDKTGKRYYMVKNSWGTDIEYESTWFMSADYMRLNTFYLFLNRHALPEALRKTVATGYF